MRYNNGRVRGIPQFARIDPNNADRRVAQWRQDHDGQYDIENWHKLFENNSSMEQIADALESGELNEYLGVKS